MNLFSRIRPQHLVEETRNLSKKPKVRTQKRNLSYHLLMVLTVMQQVLTPKLTLNNSKRHTTTSPTIVTPPQVITSKETAGEARARKEDVGQEEGVIIMLMT